MRAACAVALVLSLLGPIASHPDNLRCADTRMALGQTIMRHTVALQDPEEGEVGLDVEPTSYTPGQNVTIRAGGWTLGDYIVVGVTDSASAPIGRFTEYDERVIDATCPSQVYHRTEWDDPPTTFHGVWTAPSSAAGDITVKMLWSGGPGGWGYVSYLNVTITQAASGGVWGNGNGSWQSGGGSHGDQLRDEEISP